MKPLYAFGAVLILQFTSVPTAWAQKQRGNVITHEEIRQATAKNAYELLRELRPMWFRAHSAPPTQAMVSARDVDASGVVFYVEGVRRSADQLAEMIVQHIKEARFLTGQTASRKYGTGHEYGAVEIATAK